MAVFAFGVAVGAVVAYFLDREHGTKRRNEARDRTTSFVRQRGAGATQAVKSQTSAVSQKVRHMREEPKDLDDATIADKVRSEALRGDDIPSGHVSVNVQKGVVQLRGEVQRPDLIAALVERTHKVQGVVDVENLLHVPGSEAPMHK